MEQRRSKRFEIRLPLRLVRNGGRLLTASGETRNLSSSGVLFSTSELIEVGEPLEYIITLPPAEGPKAIELRCFGKVMRRDALAEDCELARNFRVAATLERYEFLRRG